MDNEMDLEKDMPLLYDAAHRLLVISEKYNCDFEEAVELLIEFVFDGGNNQT